MSATSYRCGLIQIHNYEGNDQNRRFHQRIRRKALAEMREHPGGIVMHLAMFATIPTGRLAPFRLWLWEFGPSLRRVPNR